MGSKPCLPQCLLTPFFLIYLLLNLRAKRPEKELFRLDTE